MNELRDEIELSALNVTEADIEAGKTFVIDPALQPESLIDVTAWWIKLFSWLVGAIRSRERELKSSLAANREQKAEIERLKCHVEDICGYNDTGHGVSYYRSKLEKAESQLASLRASVGEKWTAYSESKPAYGETVEVLFSGPEIALCHREQEELAEDDMREPMDIIWDENGDQERSVMGIFWRKFAPPTLPGEEK